MHILVTAGNTQTPVDRVRCITNIFSGRTGAQIAAQAFDRGHTVVFVTSHPEALNDIPSHRPRNAPEWRVRPYRTFDDLDTAMADELAQHRYDAVVHAAAVSDYRSAGIFALAPGTTFDDATLAWDWSDERPRLQDVASGKVKSTHGELWLRLVPTPKLVDKIRDCVELHRDLGEVQTGGWALGSGTCNCGGTGARPLGRRPDGRQHTGRYARVGHPRRRQLPKGSAQNSRTD